ncbi:MAG: DUF4301 family protein [Bacteroidetes bacterium]|nr:DUF4301 family protein [Bacteroidota bacterium]MBU1580605.1 DUF4301 family protein [Bacteroidota bacterium]MBU2556800.1 DUF4301 family protein [Bacteroidota bacterium]
MTDFLTGSDKNILAAKGISEDHILHQIKQFQSGFPFINLVAPATIEKGIYKLDNDNLQVLIDYFEENRSAYSVLKFVPASGAASRMFKSLFEFIETYKNKEIAETLLTEKSDFNSVAYFFTHLKQFAFYGDLKLVLEKDSLDLNKLLSDNDLVTILEYLLLDKGLGYGNLPKALLKFHHYADGNRLALEEHLVEAAVYSSNHEGHAKVHFTISPEHKTIFEQAINSVKEKYEKQFNVKFFISYSEQKSSTDTLAVDLQNNPFRNTDSSLLFRPGGHGALIENLNDLKEEIVFIKNIDNIVPDTLREETYRYKKAIGGLLMELQDACFQHLEWLEMGDLEDHEVDEIAEFTRNKLMIDLTDAFEGYSKIEKIDMLYTKLNRPMRVCGMVKNEGEPGGGPFWVINEDDEQSLQIVESSQIDKNEKNQMAIVEKATHFNPVDLVCSLYDFKGNKFKLHDFIDPQTGFISVKSKDGKDLKALELPGLWNGAMADWITIFVETPIITFNPVKTVNDLLRPQHQA